MSEKAPVFAGSIPGNYHQYLVPLSFEGYAADLAQQLDVPSGGAVLELACGTGVVTKHLRGTLPAATRLVATDLNPGSAPLTSPLLAMNMACVLFGLTPEEALAGMTRNAAPVLGMGGERGVLEMGAHGDLAVWDVGHPAELSYWMGANPCRTVVHAGRIVTKA